MKVLYNCDPAKNIDCRKNECFINGGQCHKTTHREFASDPDNVQVVMPMTEEDIKAVFGSNREERRANGFIGKK